MTNMIYVGTDIGKSKHCMAAISESAAVLLAPRFVEQTREGFEQMHSRLLELGGRAEVKIGMEASGHYWTHLHRFLVSKGWTVELINPVLSSSQGRRHLRGRKSDKDDALHIAKAVRDGGYRPWKAPCEQVERLKLLCRQRGFAVSELSNAKRRLTGLLDQSFPEFAALFSDAYGKAPVALLRLAASAEAMAALSTRRIASALREASRGRHGAEKARAVRQAAAGSVAAGRRCEALELSISMMLDQLAFLQGQIDRLDAAIAEAYEAVERGLARLPGIGKVTGPAIVAEYGDLSRFQGGYKKLQAYAGLDPRIRESGQWKGTVKMSKRGSPALRTALFKAASMGRLHCPQLQAIYHHHRHVKGKNHRVAISHVARKLVQLIWVVWRNGATYDPSKITPNTA